MKIKELFDKDIERNINGVIKVGQDDADSILQELDEYVVTKELDKHFNDFFNRHNHSLDAPTDKIGVWIAGFFGSGKSHFLKILAYILENREIDRQRAIDFFDNDRIKDPILRANIQRSAHTPADVILFNIDSKADASGKSQKDSIVKVFQKVFDEKLGYFGAEPAIAEFERQLDKKGNYLGFKNAFQSINGEAWETERNTWGFCQEQIAEALHISLGMSADESNRLIDHFNQPLEITPEKFARGVKEYLDRQSRQHQVLFMVDEVGQYIGENSDLMLNLQTVVEDLGVACQGRSWVVVTSQEAMDEITKNRLKGNDFSKIVGRFGRPLSLSSANTDEVIRLRLLVKKEAAQEYLKDLYAHKEAILKNQVTFSQDCADLPSYLNAEEFAATYPFIPYQFKLLQKVFEQIRLTGAAGKHLAMGERSLLDAFQIAAKDFAERESDILVPFDRFYLAIEGFLDTSVKRTIAQAAENSQLQSCDLDIFKTLFMIKYVQSIRANLDNLTTLSLSEIDQDRLALRDRLRASLERLERQTLIQREGDLYIFLTQEEQDIGREIKNVAIDPSEITNQLQTAIWGTIFPDKKYKFDDRHQYEFNRKIDDRTVGNQQDDFTLHIITRNADRYRDFQEDTNCLMATSAGQEVLIRLPDDQHLIDEINELVKTTKYISDKSRIGLSTSIQKILDVRDDQNSKRKNEIANILRKLIAEADVFACGNRVNISARDTRSVILQGLQYLVENVYSKLDYVGSGFHDESAISNTLSRNTEQQNLLNSDHPNVRAHGEINLYLEDEARSQRRVSVRNLVDKFKARPYGWAEFDVLGVFAELVNLGKAELRHHTETVNPKEKDLVKRLISKVGKDEYLVRLTQEVDLSAVKVARDLASDGLFEQNPASDWQRLYDQYREALNKQHLAPLQEWLNLADRDRLPFPLPFAQELTAHLGLIRKLLDHDGAANFFRLIKEHQEELESYIDDRQKLHSFFTSQINIFQNAIAQLKALEPDLHHIQDEALRQRVETAKQILALPDPTKRIPELKAVLQPVQDRVREVLRSRIDTVQQQSLQMREQVQTYVTQAYVSHASGDLGDRLNAIALSSATADLDRVVAIANQSKNIDAAIARETELKSLYNSLISRIDEQAIAIQREMQQAAQKQAQTDDTTNQPPVEIPVIKPITVICATDLVTKPILETEEEVKEYVTALGRAMIKEIRQGKRVRLE